MTSRTTVSFIKPDYGLIEILYKIFYWNNEPRIDMLTNMAIKQKFDYNNKQIINSAVNLCVNKASLYDQKPRVMMHSFQLFLLLTAGCIMEMMRPKILPRIPAGRVP